MSRHYSFRQTVKLAQARGAIRQQMTACPFLNSTAEIALPFAVSALETQRWVARDIRHDWRLAWRFARVAARRMSWVLSPELRVDHFTGPLVRDTRNVLAC